MAAAQAVLPANGARFGGNQSCLRSTELFPGWTVALTTDNMAPQLTKRMVETILAMPIDPSSGMGWSVATEFSRVNDVFHVLRIGPYAYLRDWTLSRIWRDFWPSLQLRLLCWRDLYSIPSRWNVWRSLVPGN